MHAAQGLQTALVVAVIVLHSPCASSFSVVFPGHLSAFAGGLRAWSPHQALLKPRNPPRHACFAIAPRCAGGELAHPRHLVLGDRSASTWTHPSRTHSLGKPLIRRTARESRTALKDVIGTGVFLYSKWEVAVAFNSALGALVFLTGKYKNALTLWGLVNSWILGVILWGSLGSAGWTTCFFYLLAGSAVTKVKMAEKEAQGIAEARGGARGPENVWGAAAAAAICALLASLSPWDSGIFKLGFVASLATKLSDTFASEIGKAYGKTTYLSTTFKRVPPGTEGAVSLEGTLAGVVGSLILAGFGYLVGLIGWEGIAISAFAAVIATTAESIIGATLQGKVWWMTNEVVNFINTAIGAVVAMACWLPIM